MASKFLKSSLDQEQVKGLLAQMIEQASELKLHTAEEIKAEAEQVLVDKKAELEEKSATVAGLPAAWQAMAQAEVSALEADVQDMATKIEAADWASIAAHGNKVAAQSVIDATFSAIFTVTLPPAGGGSNTDWTVKFGNKITGFQFKKNGQRHWALNATALTAEQRENAGLPDSKEYWLTDAGIGKATSPNAALKLCLGDVIINNSYFYTSAAVSTLEEAVAE